MDWIAPLLNVVVIALLVWSEYRLSRRVAALEAADMFADENVEYLLDRIIVLESQLATKTRAVKKPVAS